MRRKDFELEAKTYGNLSIDLDDEYQDMYFYKLKESNYNYIKRKYINNYQNSGYYVGLYENESTKRGYFYVCENMLLKNEHIYQKYTRYIELLEFGFNNNDINQVNFLIDYLYYYCQGLGAQFLKIKTKEKAFCKFYELIKKFNHTTYKDYIYIDIVPLEFENLKHLKKYKGDKLTFKELYHLNQIGFDFDEEKGVLNLYNDQYIKIDRKTRRLTYSSVFKNLKDDSRFNYWNADSSSLIHYFKMNYYDICNNGVIFDYKIQGLEDKEFIRSGRKLITLEHEKYLKDYRLKEEIADFAKEVCSKTDILSMDIVMNSYFRWKSYYASVSSVWVYLYKYFEGEEEIEEY